MNLSLRTVLEGLKLDLPIFDFEDFPNKHEISGNLFKHHPTKGQEILRHFAAFFGEITTRLTLK